MAANRTRIRAVADPEPEAALPDYPMERPNARRVTIAPINITPRVQMFALGCLTLILLTLISVIGGV